MRFYTSKECERWCEVLRIPLDDHLNPAREFSHPYRLRCTFPVSFPKLLWFSRCIESALQPRQNCLLWVTDFNIFCSNENLHLYYRLRQSYGDIRLLDEAPGHLCLDYERAEVVTLIHLSILFGWDIHLIPANGYGRAFVCHDEWAEIGFEDQRQFDELRKTFEQAELEISVNDPA